VIGEKWRNISISLRIRQLRDIPYYLRALTHSLCAN